MHSTVSPVNTQILAAIRSAVSSNFSSPPHLNLLSCDPLGPSPSSGARRAVPAAPERGPAGQWHRRRACHRWGWNSGLQLGTPPRSPARQLGATVWQAQTRRRAGSPANWRPRAEPRRAEPSSCRRSCRGCWRWARLAHIPHQTNCCCCLHVVSVVSVNGQGQAAGATHTLQLIQTELFLLLQLVRVESVLVTVCSTATAAALQSNEAGSTNHLETVSVTSAVERT